MSSDKLNSDTEYSPTKATEFNIESVLPQFDGKKWYQLAHIRKLCFVVFVISFTACNNGYDGSLLNSLYTETDFNNAIGNVSGAILGALTNGYIFGCMLAFFPTPYLVDNLGRVPALNIGNSITIIGVIIQSCAGVWKHHGIPDGYQGRDIFGMLIAARIILGIGVGIIWVAAPALISELSFPTHRQICSTYYNSSWYLGAIVASWVSYGARNLANHWNWRVPSIVQGFFPLCQLILVPLLVPESPRFYVSKGKIEEARAVLDKYHGGGYPGSNALVDYELTEMQLAIEQERSANDKSSYRDFIATAANRKRLWILFWVGTFMQLSGNGLVSYYLSKVLDSIGIHSSDEKLIVNGGLMIYNWGICIIQSFFIVPFMKRRHAFIVSSSGMLLSYVVWTVLSAINQKRNFEDTSLAKGVLAMIFFYYLFYNWGLNGLPFTYMTECLPFTLRGKGINLFTLVQYVWMIYNGFVNSVAMDAIEWKYYIVWCAILAVEVIIVVFSFIETSGYTLEEVAQVFGDSADLGNVGANVLKDAEAKEAAEHVEYKAQ